MIEEHLVEIGARAIMAEADIKWSNSARYQALKHSRAALEAVIPLVLADTIPKPKDRKLDRHSPGYYARYRERVAQEIKSGIRKPTPRVKK